MKQFFLQLAWSCPSLTEWSLCSIWCNNWPIYSRKPDLFFRDPLWQQHERERETWNQPHAINCNRCKHWICFSVTQGKSGFTAGYHWRGNGGKRRGKSTWQWRASGPRLHIIWFDLKTDWWKILKGLCTHTAGTCCSQAGAPPHPREHENSALHSTPCSHRLTWPNSEESGSLPQLHSFFGIHDLH